MAGAYDALSKDVPDFRGKNVLVMGLGSFGGGTGVARFLARRGARVLVTDVKTETELSDSVRELQPLGVSFRLGGHDEADFRRADLVVLSPAVDPSSKVLALARALDTEMNLFFKLNRARTVLGVTGTNGKTTTTVLAYEVLRRLPRTRAWLGGNVGISLLESVELIEPRDAVVLELSSFQLEALRALHVSPSVSVVTNVTPNHLDRHGTMESYIFAKRAILDYQRPEDACVLNLDDPVAASLPHVSRLAGFSLLRKVPEGAWAEEGMKTLVVQGRRIDVSARRLRGAFNVQNMLAAAEASLLAAPEPDGWAEAAEEAFGAFAGVEHRLEFVGERQGVSFYNDSIATNPDSTIAALGALPGPFVLILGGYDKKLPFEKMAAKIRESDVRLVVLMGQAAGKIREALAAGNVPSPIREAMSLGEAVEISVAAALPGDQVLLSPACASFDQFRNFVERGNLFKKLVAALGAGRP